MGKASRRKQERKKVHNAATEYLDWVETQPPAPHNCTPSVNLDGKCSQCPRRWKPTIGKPGRFYGQIIGWEPADQVPADQMPVR